MTGPLLAVDPTSGDSLLAAFGALAVLVVVFAESGLLVVGFLLPGDTLLLPAGVLCAAGSRTGPHLSLWQVMLCAAVGAIAGAQLGFLLGRHGGRPLLARTRSGRLKAAAARGEALLRRYGYRKAIVIGRFVPLVRTVLSPLAGMLDVPTRTFTLWQIVGGVLWSQSLVLAGYWLGAAVPGIEHYLWLLVGAVVVLSLLPLLLHPRKGPRTPPDGG
ncbi:DedA family protein [Kitasatospora sp. NPDC052868]|uniref:DedA family protein n=1 Tax=Kitasatospora sp. NPDC052868 TaxID=3364060 RepID=UPI0037C742BD